MRQNATVEQASHTEKNGRENGTTLPAVPTAALLRKKHRKTKLENAANGKKLNYTRSKTRVNINSSAMATANGVKRPEK